MTSEAVANAPASDRPDPPSSHACPGALTHMGGKTEAIEIPLHETAACDNAADCTPTPPTEGST